MNNANYITILGWMINELKLSGVEAMIFAVIYSFSRDGESKYAGSLNWLAEAVGASKSTVQRYLKSLVDKKYIIRNEKVVNGITFAEYKIDQRVVNLTRGYSQFEHGGIVNLTTNNTNNINNNIKKNISNDIQEKSHRYGEYGHVFLTDKEHQELVTKYGKARFDMLTQKIDDYIDKTGKTYKRFRAVYKTFADHEPKYNNGVNQQSLKKSLDDYEIKEGLI